MASSSWYGKEFSNKKPVTGMEGFETFLFNTSVLYNLLVVYAFVQALVLILMLCSFIQRWYIPAA